MAALTWRYVLISGSLSPKKADAAQRAGPRIGAAGERAALFRKRGSPGAGFAGREGLV
jgi:hypothetical protein